MAITSCDNLINALGNTSQSAPCGVWSDTSVTTATNIPFLFNLIQPGPLGLIPTPTVKGSGGEIPTAATAGSLINFTNPTGGNSTYLSNFYMGTQTGPGSIAIYDRVYAASGFSGTVTSAQTITSFPTLTRPGSTGLGLQIVLEYYTAPIGGTQQVTVQYTNSAGTSGRNTKSTLLANTVRAGGLTFCTLQDGDAGVQSIQSVTVALTTTVAGNFGVALYNPLMASAAWSTTTSVAAIDFGETRLPTINDSASLVMVVNQTSTTATSQMMGHIKLIQG